MSQLVDQANGVCVIFFWSKNTAKLPTMSYWSCGHIWNIQPQIAFKLSETDTQWPLWKHLSDWVTHATWKSDHFSAQQTFSAYPPPHLLILWTVCRDWWLTQHYPAPTASQVTRHLGLAETAAHWVSWKCFNRDVETVEKCIILHIATKNCTFLRVQIFCMMTVMTWRMISLVQSKRSAARTPLPDTSWTFRQNLHKNLQKFATVLY